VRLERLILGGTKERCLKSNEDFPTLWDTYCGRWERGNIQKGGIKGITARAAAINFPTRVN